VDTEEDTTGIEDTEEAGEEDTVGTEDMVEDAAGMTTTGVVGRQAGTGIGEDLRVPGRTTGRGRPALTARDP